VTPNYPSGVPVVVNSAVSTTITVTVNPQTGLVGLNVSGLFDPTKSPSLTSTVPDFQFLILYNNQLYNIDYNVLLAMLSNSLPNLVKIQPQPISVAAAANIVVNPSSELPSSDLQSALNLIATKLAALEADFANMTFS
jgi:hypothetical protein